MNEQSAPTSARGQASHEEGETTALGPNSNTDTVTMADAGLTGGGATTATPATGATETVPGDGGGHENDEAGS